MRVLIVLVALVVGIYSGWHQSRKSGGEHGYAGASAGCPSEITAQQVSIWAREAAIAAFVLKAGELVETTSDRSLFSKQGWDNYIFAFEAAMLTRDGRVTETRLGADVLTLEVIADPVASPSSIIENGVVASWQVNMPVKVVPAGAPMSGIYDLLLTLGCTRNDTTLPLAIDQWIMSVAK